MVLSATSVDRVLVAGTARRGSACGKDGRVVEQQHVRFRRPHQRHPGRLSVEVEHQGIDPSGLCVRTLRRDRQPSSAPAPASATGSRWVVGGSASRGAHGPCRVFTCQPVWRNAVRCSSHRKVQRVPSPAENAAVLAGGSTYSDTSLV